MSCKQDCRLAFPAGAEDQTLTPIPHSGSQRERIQMIRVALETKGVSTQSLSHYLGREGPAADGPSQENGGTDIARGPDRTNESTIGGIDL